MPQKRNRNMEAETEFEFEAYPSPNEENLYDVYRVPLYLTLTPDGVFYVVWSCPLLMRNNSTGMRCQIPVKGFQQYRKSTNSEWHRDVHPVTIAMPCYKVYLVPYYKVMPNGSLILSTYPVVGVQRYGTQLNRGSPRRGRGQGNQRNTAQSRQGRSGQKYFKRSPRNQRNSFVWPAAEVYSTG